MAWLLTAVNGSNGAGASAVAPAPAPKATALGKRYAPLRQDMTAEEKKAKLAYAKTTIGITMRDGGSCRIEENVYGAALLMPQIARTVGWDKTIASLAVRSWLFLGLNVFVQAYLLSMLGKEEEVMDAYAGQMYLCDIGAFSEIEDGPGGMGPGGTLVTASRMYSYGSWSNRNFVRDSLKLLFPVREGNIQKLIDPGEYGIESYWTRWMCCFIFMVPLMQELSSIIKALELLWSVPTSNDPWIEPGENVHTSMGAMEDVHLKIAGIPIGWKCLNVLIVVFPKLVLWKLTTETGIQMLMETAGTADMVLNSVGLTFILGIDELIFCAMMSEETRNFVLLLNDFPLYDVQTSCVGDATLLTDDEIIDAHNKHKDLRTWNWGDTMFLFPTKLFSTMFLTLVFVYQYYYKCCYGNGEGRWVAKDMHLPKTLGYSWGQAIFPRFFPLDEVETPYWTMPHPH
jgi:hypothetical protein